MNIHKAKRTFRIYTDDNGNTIFDETKLPKAAKQQDISPVYRICVKGEINAEAFMSTYAADYHNKDLDINNPSTFSTSCFSKVKDAQKLLICMKRHMPTPVIAQGKITSDSGYSLIDKDVNPKCKKSHVNWWIFDDEHPENYFFLYEKEGDAK